MTGLSARAWRRLIMTLIRRRPAATRDRMRKALVELLAVCSTRKKVQFDSESQIKPMSTIKGLPSGHDYIPQSRLLLYLPWSGLTLWWQLHTGKPDYEAVVRMEVFGGVNRAGFELNLFKSQYITCRFWLLLLSAIGRTSRVTTMNMLSQITCAAMATASHALIIVQARNHACILAASLLNAATTRYFFPFPSPAPRPFAAAELRLARYKFKSFWIWYWSLKQAMSPNLNWFSPQNRKYTTSLSRNVAPWRSGASSAPSRRQWAQQSSPGGSHALLVCHRMRVHATANLR